MPTPICKLCFRPLEIRSFVTLIDKRLTVCDACFDMFHPRFHRFTLEKIPCLAVFDYDPVIKEHLYRFKGCHDYELKDMFLERYRYYLRLLYRGYEIVPIPSWAPDDEARGFNHVESMFALLKRPMRKLLMKTRKHKQAVSSYEARRQVAKVIALCDSSSLAGRDILIVDDVMTSGATLKAAITLISSLGPRRIKVLLMSRTVDEK